MVEARTVYVILRSDGRGADCICRDLKTSDMQ
jgi:hypothetical protein